jgi:Fe-S cluster assembly iron-binding protein IscA
VIEITESAARVIDRQLAQRQLTGGGLRIAVKAGGCSGDDYKIMNHKKEIS